MVVSLKSSFVKELKRISPKIQLAILKVLQTLRDSETLDKTGLDYTRMEGQKKTEGYYRILVGQYRLGIESIHPEVIVITVLSRGNIYKHFPPK
jgi:mRNA interferase RelE/StbE